MPIKTNSTTYLHNSWVFKAFLPSPPVRSDLIILLHGWTGDENSMDIFVRALPRDVWLISPRAPVPAEKKGYSWLSTLPDMPDARGEFEKTGTQLWSQIIEWKRIFDITFSTPVTLVGFSQGGAMALLLSFLYPDHVKRAACLSGFLPIWGEDLIKP